MTPLDFSGVFDATNAPEEPQRPTAEEVFIFEDAPTAAAATDTTQPPTVEAEPVGQSLALQQEQQQRARIDEMYSTYQRNIKASAAQQTQIVKAIIDGQPLETILLMALDTVGKATGNGLFCDACVKALKEREEKEAAEIAAMLQ